jgi:hypothetical protein
MRLVKMANYTAAAVVVVAELVLLGMVQMVWFI